MLKVLNILWTAVCRQTTSPRRQIWQIGWISMPADRLLNIERSPKDQRPVSTGLEYGSIGKWNFQVRYYGRVSSRGCLWIFNDREAFIIKGLILHSASSRNQASLYLEFTRRHKYRVFSSFAYARRFRRAWFFFFFFFFFFFLFSFFFFVGW